MTDSPTATLAVVHRQDAVHAGRLRDPAHLAAIHGVVYARERGGVQVTLLRRVLERARC
jgi:hypothetical protein